MRKMLLTAAAAIAATVASPSHAVAITYSFSAVISGTLGGQAFQDANALFTLVGDTDDVFRPIASRPNIYNSGRATLDFVVDGTVGTFTEQFNAFSNVGRARFSVVGLTPENGSDLFDISDLALADYDLRTAIGPLTQSPPDFLNFGETYLTSAAT